MGDGREGINKQLISNVRSFKRARILIPREYAAYDFDELYNRLLVIAPDFKGNLSLAYGEYGLKVGLSVTANLGKFIVPFLTLQPSISGNVEVLKESLFVIHRAFPLAILAQKNSSGFKNNLPICFMALQGYKIGGGADAKLDLAIGGKFKVSAFDPNPALADIIDTPPNDGLNVPVADLGLGAELKFDGVASMEYESFKWRDFHPGWYPSGMDKTLKSDVKNALGILNEREIKKDILNWLKYIGDKILAYQYPENTEEKIILETIKDHIKNLPTISENAVLRFFEKDVSGFSVIDNMQTLIIEIIEYFKKTENKYPIFGDTKFNEDMAEDLMRQGLHYTALLDEARFAAEAKDKTGKEIPKKKSSLKVSESLKDLDLCFADLSIFSRELTGDTNAWLGLKLDPKIAAEISANAKLEGNFKKVSSRYQTFSVDTHSQKLLIFTQDVCINYKQVYYNLKANANAELRGLLEKEYSGVPEFIKEDLPDEMIHNMMTYNATTHYWLHPGVEKILASVPLLEGSGISFGCSIQLTNLLYMIKELAIYKKTNKKINETVDLKLQVFANCLKVPKEQFIAFIENIFPMEADQKLIAEKESDDLVKNLFPELVTKKISTVLLEASYKLNPQKINTVEFKGEGEGQNGKIDSLYKEEKFKSLFDLDKKATYTKDDLLKMDLSLETMRVRVRLMDSLTEGDSTVFKLGFGALKKLAGKFLGQLPISFSFSGKEIKRSGNEGILDLYVHWFEDRFNETSKDSSEMSERSIAMHDYIERGVPAVTLLPHAF